MATNPVPMVNLQYEVFDETERILGVAQVTLPELDLMTADVKGSGILGQMEWPIWGAFDNMQLTMQFRVIFVNLTSLLSPHAHMITLRNVYEKYDAASGTREPHGLKIVCRGLAKNLNNGSLEVGESADAEIQMNLDYYKVEDNKDGVLIEIDRFNNVYNINDVDYYSDIINLLGL